MKNMALLSAWVFVSGALLVACSGGSSGASQSGNSSSSSAATAILFDKTDAANLALITTSDGHQIAIQGTKDAQGNYLSLTSIFSDTLDGNALNSATITYDAQGRPVNVTLANGAMLTLNYASPTTIQVTFVVPDGRSVGPLTINPATNSISLAFLPRGLQVFAKAWQHHLREVVQAVVQLVEPPRAMAQETGTGTGKKGEINVTCGLAPLARVDPLGNIRAAYTFTKAPAGSFSAPLTLTADANTPGRFTYEIPFNPFIPPTSPQLQAVTDQLKNLFNKYCTEKESSGLTNQLLDSALDKIKEEITAKADQICDSTGACEILKAQATSVILQLQYIGSLLCAAGPTMIVLNEQVTKFAELTDRYNAGGTITLYPNYNGVSPEPVPQPVAVNPATPGPVSPIAIDFPIPACVSIQFFMAADSTVRPSTGQSSLTKNIRVVRTGNAATMRAIPSSLVLISWPPIAGPSGTAVPGVDLQPFGGTQLEFHSSLPSLEVLGQMTQAIDFPANVLPGSGTVEDKTANIRLSSPINARLDKNQIETLTITNVPTLEGTWSAYEFMGNTDWVPVGTPTDCYQHDCMTTVNSYVITFSPPNVVGAMNQTTWNSTTSQSTMSNNPSPGSTYTVGCNGLCATITYPNGASYQSIRLSLIDGEWVMTLADLYRFRKG